MKNNYKLTIQYDGTRYKGWQRLGSRENTIQGKIEHVLSEMVGQPIEIVGCSRTDAGVHALAQIANFKTNQAFKEKEIKDYLNKYLPKDITVSDVRSVDERFHARYNAKDKTYVYKIWNEDYLNPFMRNYSMHVEKKLDLKAMQKASETFVGSHDFTTFSNAKSKKKSMVRDIYAIDIKDADGFIEIRIRGNGFLYNMVRKMVGVLIEVGLGRLEAKDIEVMLQTKERSQVNYMAFAGGLFLEKIDY